MISHLSNKWLWVFLKLHVFRGVLPLLVSPVISTIQAIVALNILSPCTSLKCDFTGWDIILLILWEPLVNLTPGYAAPGAGHCTNQTKDRFLSQSAQPNKLVNLQVFWNASETSFGKARSLTQGMPAAVMWHQTTPHIPNAQEKYHQPQIFLSWQDFPMPPPT